MEAVIRTTKGDINVFLYPEAAPKNVANFVANKNFNYFYCLFLSKNFFSLLKSILPHQFYY